ncbi:hypothetical protein BH09MYX1_BH09MYX1_36640 [soil metagenome]
MAVTFVAAASFTLHGATPVQPPPLQPVNVEPSAGAAVKTTVEPAPKVALQAVPQSMPAGAEVTFPVPAPASTIVNATGPLVSVEAAASLPASVSGGAGSPVQAVKTPEPIRAATRTRARRFIRVN